MVSHGRYDSQYARTLFDCSMEELVAKQRAICADPKNRNTNMRDPETYTKAAQGKLNAIARAITSLLAEKRRAAEKKEQA